VTHWTRFQPPLTIRTRFVVLRSTPIVYASPYAPLPSDHSPWPLTSAELTPTNAEPVDNAMSSAPMSSPSTLPVSPSASAVAFFRSDECHSQSSFAVAWFHSEIRIGSSSDTTASYGSFGSRTTISPRWPSTYCMPTCEWYQCVPCG